MARAIVYDFGMNNGDDVEYYLAKGHAVVAVEANPVLCEVCEIRFADAIQARRLTILNAVVTDADEEGEVDFYIHKKDHVLSQFPTPRPDQRDHFYRVRLPGIPAATIVRRHGDPHYIKIDLEGFDQNILRNLFCAGIRPVFVSAESHSVEVFALLCAFGYKSFNLVDGESVRDVYRSAVISCETGRRRRDFPFHSAGPYGYDLTSPWLDAEQFFYRLAKERLGWKDIHASLRYMPRPFARTISAPAGRFRWDFEPGRGWPATRYAPPVGTGEAWSLPGYPAAALSPAGFATSAWP